MLLAGLIKESPQFERGLSVSFLCGRPAIERMELAMCYQTNHSRGYLKLYLPKANGFKGHGSA